MGDIMLLIERWIATMPFQTSRRKIQDSEASQKVAGGGVGRGLEGHEARAEAENQYDVRRKERGEELKRAEKRRRDLPVYVPNDAGHLTTLALVPSSERCHKLPRS